VSWIVEESGFDPDRITINGNKYMLGNGAMGYRGTLEEFSKEQLTACTLAGLYDKVGDQWREPVNAPNGWSVGYAFGGEALNVLSSAANRISSRSISATRRFIGKRSS